MRHVITTSPNRNNLYSRPLSPRTIYNEEESLKTRQLLVELNTKNSEIVNLNSKIGTLEKTRNQMIIDLEEYQNIINNLEEKMHIKEIEYINKLRLSELENDNLRSQLESLNFSKNNFNLSESMITKENTKLKEDLFNTTQKLDFYYYFYNDLQNVLLDKNTSKSLFNNLDEYDLKKKFHDIFDEIFKLKNSTPLSNRKLFINI